MAHARLPLLPPATVRAARRRLADSGEVPVELVGATLARSWMRSAQAGLTPTGRPAGAPHASAAQLARAIEHQRELVAHSRPVMEFLYEQTRESDSVVILADAQGMLLQALGDASFVDRAERVALRPGANWHERWRGTNAIGTALAEDQALVVHGAEHFLERNAFLTCAAAPIHDSAGHLVGALDLSGDHRGFHRHTLGLVRSAARMIEQRLFQTRHAGGLRVHLHPRAEGIGTVAESLLALSEDGWILGANEAALHTLDLRWTDIGARHLRDLLDLGASSVQDLARRATTAPVLVRTRGGATLWLRADPGPTVIQSGPIAAPPRVSAPPKDALAALDTGDPVARAALDRARRVLDKKIALLFLGESGTGKELFARAVHLASPRKDRPFIAVNCAALPESLIESELFGYRPGAFTGGRREGAPGRIREADGGTLFLDEIGDMPLTMQARLLRVLQDRQVIPLGGGAPVDVDVQLICATHRSLRDEMQAGRFRADLYYRINGLALQLPPLRERQDLDALIARMLHDLSPTRALTVSPDVFARMAAYPWPGNLRQLHNALRTAAALMDADETEVDWHHLPDDLAQELREDSLPAPAPDPKEDTGLSLRDTEQRRIERAVNDAHGNMSEAARALGISRNTLYRKLKPGPPR